MLGITEQLNLYCMQIIDTTHWSVGSLLASFSAHEKAPLCSQQYVSTATVCPRYFFTLMGSEASLMNCNRPWIPMLSVWKDRCLKMLVYQSPVWATLSDEEKKKVPYHWCNVNVIQIWSEIHDPHNILKSQQKTFPNRPTGTTIEKREPFTYKNV